MGNTTRMQAKGQVTLPLEARRELGVAAGDELVWVRNEAGRWEIWPVDDLLDDFARDLEEVKAWSKHVKPGYRPNGGGRK